jgi:acetyl esterase/lipase
MHDKDAQELERILADGDSEADFYKSTPSGKLKMLVKKPEAQRKSGRRKAILFIHGSGWSGSSPNVFLPHLAYFAARGYACFSAERNPPTKQFPIECALEDCCDAMRHIRRKEDDFGIDRKRLIVLGDSAGGWLAARLGTPAMLADPEKEQASFVVNAIAFWL